MKTRTRWFLSQLDSFFSFSRVVTSGSNKINLNSSVYPIHSLPAKLSIPSNPHLLIIALSCMLKKKKKIQYGPLSDVVDQPHLVPRGTFVIGFSCVAHLTQTKKKGLTGCCEHLFASEHCVCSRHKAQHLFRFAQRLSSSGEADDRLGEDDSGSCNRSEHSRERHRLVNHPVNTTSQGRARNRLASFFSRGVPGIGTRALTGNDSGCSGRLQGDPWSSVAPETVKGEGGTWTTPRSAQFDRRQSPPIPIFRQSRR